MTKLLQKQVQLQKQMEKMKKTNKDSLVHLVFFVIIQPQDYSTELKKLDSMNQATNMEC